MSWIACINTFQFVITMLTGVHLLMGLATIDSVIMSKIELCPGSKQRFPFFGFCFVLSKLGLFWSYIFFLIKCIFAAILWVTMCTPGHFFWFRRNEPHFTEFSTPSRFVRSWYEQSLLHYSLCFTFIILMHT